MKNLRYHFPTCYAYSVKEPIGELNLRRALDEDTGVFFSFFSLLSSSSPLGQMPLTSLYLCMHSMRCVCIVFVIAVFMDIRRT